MTVREHRTMSIAVFTLAMFVSVVLYVVMIRQFGALPEVRRNSEHIKLLESKVDSLRNEVRSP